MLTSIVRRSITRITLHRFYVSLAANNYTLATNQRRSKISALQCITLKHNAISHRYIFNENNDLTKFLPLLPGYVHKNRTIMATLSMLFIEHMTLRPLVDPDFDINNIVYHITNAACKVSLELVNQNYGALVDLVEEDTLKLLRQKIDSLTQFQRNLIAIRNEDIEEFTPAYVRVEGVSKSEDNLTYKICVEVNVLIFYAPRYGRPDDEEEDDENTPDNLKVPEELVANYVFVRTYTQDGGSDWMIKYINLDTKSIFSGY